MPVSTPLNVAVIHHADFSSCTHPPSLPASTCGGEAVPDGNRVAGVHAIQAPIHLTDNPPDLSDIADAPVHPIEGVVERMESVTSFRLVMDLAEIAQLVILPGLANHRAHAVHEGLEPVFTGLQNCEPDDRVGVGPQQMVNDPGTLSDRGGVFAPLPEQRVPDRGSTDALRRERLEVCDKPPPVLCILFSVLTQDCAEWVFSGGPSDERHGITERKHPKRHRRNDRELGSDGDVWIGERVNRGILGQESLTGFKGRRQRMHAPSLSLYAPTGSEPEQRLHAFIAP